MDINISINISGDKVTVNTGGNENNILQVPRNVNNVSLHDYLEYDDLLDKDDISVVLTEYFMYKGLLGLRVKHGRLFKEIRKFENDIEQYGQIDDLEEKLKLTSEEGASNFIDFVNVKKDDIDKVTVYDCMSMIGLCSLVLDIWRKERYYSRWKYCVEAIRIFINDFMLSKIKGILQNRLIYEEMS
ncbi:hypothetical protein Murmansk-170 [Murmansk poxvirus]|uniref:Toll/IL1-receptor [TIR]-like protein n=1 Tax=Murmansk poxvirus TaxID=2025359 RepID=A0A223FMZ7_9POXV|nr:hypothetical protein CKM52_gp170 [Murmansk poxvirus]AST09365.1 hypothetical protein Murmansk-170 [Murmansk poxvirus]